MSEIRYKWESGNRAFYWNENVPYIDPPLCLQSKEYNHTYLNDRSRSLWSHVHYSKSDAKRLYKFLKKIFEDK